MRRAGGKQITIRRPSSSTTAGRKRMGGKRLRHMTGGVRGGPNASTKFVTTYRYR